jgi:hypothetical protein
LVRTIQPDDIKLFIVVEVAYGHGPTHRRAIEDLRLKRTVPVAQEHADPIWLLCVCSDHDVGYSVAAKICGYGIRAVSVLRNICRTKDGALIQQQRELRFEPLPRIGEIGIHG